MVTQAIQSVLSLLLLIALGYYVAGRSWFGKAGASIFSKFTVTVAIPCYMFYNVISTTGSRQALLQIALRLPIPIVTIVVSLLVGVVLAKLLGISESQRGVFINAVTFSNTVIIGFPVVEALFGSAASPDAMVYYMGNTLLFWTVGVFMLRHDGGSKVRFFSASGLRAVLAPPMLGMLLGVLVVIVGLPIPQFVEAPLVMLKQITTPLSMIFIGSIMRESISLVKKPDKGLVGIVVARFIFTPIVMLLFCGALPLPLLTKQVFFVLATMPAMTQLAIMAKESNSDYRFASVVITVTTGLSLVAIPAYMLVLERIW